MNSKLTLSYGALAGCRASRGWQPGENFDQNTNSIVVPDNLAGVSDAAGVSRARMWRFNQSFNGTKSERQYAARTKYVTASQDGLPPGLRHIMSLPAAVSIYRPFNDTKTVLRAGFRLSMTNPWGRSRSTTAAILLRISHT